MPKLNKGFVDALKAVTRDTLYRDRDLSGFALRVKPSGTAAWVVQYRNAAGSTRKLALGRVGVLTPDEARQRARKALGRVADGADPPYFNAARGAMTVASLCRDYLAAADEGLVLGKNGDPNPLLRWFRTAVGLQATLSHYWETCRYLPCSLWTFAALPACCADGQDRQNGQSKGARCHPDYRWRGYLAARADRERQKSLLDGSHGTEKRVWLPEAIVSYQCAFGAENCRMQREKNTTAAADAAVFTTYFASELQSSDVIQQVTPVSTRSIQAVPFRATSRTCGYCWQRV